MPLPKLAARPLGLVLMVLAVTMALCALVGLALRDLRGVAPMLGAAGICAAAAAAAIRWGKVSNPRIGRREALVVVSAAWVGAGIFGGLPFILGAGFSVPDAFFEAVSGFTTTGATILPEIEQRLSPPLHLWRMLTHWLGGLGIVVLFVAIFPALGVGGKQLFKMEAPGPKPEGVTPRIRDTARALLKVYTVLTVLEALLLWAAGMSPFDALVHSFATMGTGGFSTRNASIAAYDSVAVDVVVTVFMLIAGANFGLLFEATRRGWGALWNDVELRVYLGIAALATLVVAVNIHGAVHATAGSSLRYAVFQVSSIMTTTGFGTDDFEKWPALSQVVLVFLYFFGGCAGSTAGGLKIIRVIILTQLVVNEIRRGYRPALVVPVRVGHLVIPSGVVTEALACLMLFVSTTGLGGLVVAMFDQVDLTTAFMSSLACVANVGPGLGMVGPVDNYGFLSPVSKVTLSFCMLLGRLEFFTLLALVFPKFWRR